MVKNITKILPQIDLRHVTEQEKTAICSLYDSTVATYIDVLNNKKNPREGYMSDFAYPIEDYGVLPDSVYCIGSR